MRLLLLLQERRPSRKTPRRRQTSHQVFASHLDIQDYTGHQDHINHRILRKTNQMGTHLLRLHQILPYIPFGNQLDYSSTWSFHCLRPMYTPVLSVVRHRREANLATKYTGLPVSWKYLLYFSHSVCIHCFFFAIYPKLLNIPFNSVALYSTGIYTHPFTFKPFHHGPY